MFLGHFALALAAKQVAPKTSLGTTSLAANLADLVWPLLLVLDVEQVQIVPGLMAASPFDFTHYPWSHSLLAGVVAGLCLGLGYYFLRRYPRGALVVGALVVSHFVLDYFFHRADLPIWPGGPKVGLGLWQSLPITLVAEAVALGLGVFVYRRMTVAIDRAGNIAFWALVSFLAAIYVSSIFGPPPPSGHTVGWMALGGWVVVPWAYYIDRHRRLRSV